MPGGTHFCLFYETQQDLLDTLVPYFIASLENNECCIWFVDRQAQRSGFSAELAVEPAELRIPPNLETTVFRVAQIALTNVARHAQAKHVHVELRQHVAELELVIRDDGIGFDVAAALERASRGATFGLLSMQERVRLVGGALDMTSTPGMGTEIRACFPVERKDVV